MAWQKFNSQLNYKFIGMILKIKEVCLLDLCLSLKTRVYYNFINILLGKREHMVLSFPLVVGPRATQGKVKVTIYVTMYIKIALI